MFKYLQLITWSEIVLGVWYNICDKDKKDNKEHVGYFYKKSKGLIYHILQWGYQFFMANQHEL